MQTREVQSFAKTQDPYQTQVLDNTGWYWYPNYTLAVSPPPTHTTGWGQLEMLG
jgi:hypothetical protein